MTVPIGLHALLRAVSLPVPEGVDDCVVPGLTADSRRVVPHGAFIGLRGTEQDGTTFAPQAVANGASVLLLEDETAEVPRQDRIAGAFALRIAGLRARTGPLFDAFYGFPSKHLEFHGVTGTNGKSTTVLLMSSVLRAAGRKVVSLGTIRYQIGDVILPSELTTPSTESFYALLAQGVESGCDAVAMEVSSHALQQDRVAGVRFASGVFTNLTHDHLDFHGDLDAYFAAKRRLFTEFLAADGVVVLNLDSPHGAILNGDVAGRRFTFSKGGGGASQGADLGVVSAELTLDRTRLVLSHRGRTFTVTSRLVGALNVENLLAAAAFGLAQGISPEDVARGIADVTVPGRNEVFRLPSGAFAVVDYAHTPDALERVLLSLRDLTQGRLHCLFGCGGDRDRAKRPLMGEIAGRLADQVLLTSDNPRSEEPDAILGEIRAGMAEPGTARVVSDRRAAIREGLQALASGDCLLVAGKGHEDYQIIGAERRHFSDREEIAAWIAESAPGRGMTWN